MTRVVGTFSWVSIEHRIGVVVYWCLVGIRFAGRRQLMPSWPPFWPWWCFGSSWHLGQGFSSYMFRLASCKFYDTLFLGWKCTEREIFSIWDLHDVPFACPFKGHFPSHLPFMIVTSALLWIWPLPTRDFRKSTSCFISWRTIKNNMNVLLKISFFCYLHVINHFAPYY